MTSSYKNIHIAHFLQPHVKHSTMIFVYNTLMLTYLLTIICVDNISRKMYLTCQEGKQNVDYDMYLDKGRENAESE